MTHWAAILDSRVQHLCRLQTLDPRATSIAHYKPVVSSHPSETRRLTIYSMWISQLNVPWFRLGWNQRRACPFLSRHGGTGIWNHLVMTPILVTQLRTTRRFAIVPSAYLHYELFEDLSRKEPPIKPPVVLFIWNPRVLRGPGQIAELRIPATCRCRCWWSVWTVVWHVMQSASPVAQVDIQRFILGYQQDIKW